MADPLRKIARENFRDGRYLSAANREQPSRWTYAGLPRSVASGRHLVDHILQRRAAASSVNPTNVGIFRYLFTKIIRR